jgi:hypothetical protein
MPFFEKAKKVVLVWRGKIRDFFGKKFAKNRAVRITNTPQNAKISETRATGASENRDMKY